MSRRIILIDIGAGLTLSGVLPSVALYADYSARLVAGGGQPPYTYTVTSGALPAGLYIDAATGVISGTPTEAGSFPITVRVTDLSGTTVVRAFALQVIAEPLTLVGAAPDGTVGVAQSYTYTVAGGVPPYIFELVGAPDGWSVPDSSEPTIDYTPVSGGVKSWILRATDSMGDIFDKIDTATFAGATLTISGTYDVATIGTPYSSDLAISGGNGAYSNPRVTVGSLAGTGLALSVVGSALRLSGMPTGAAQTLNITVAVNSGDGQTATSDQYLAISAGSADPLWNQVILLPDFSGSDGDTTFIDLKKGNTWTNDALLAKKTSAWSLFGGTSFSVLGRLQNAISPLGTSDFTFEGAIYATSSTTRGIFALPLKPDASQFAFGYTAGKLQIYWKGTVLEHAYTMPLNTEVRYAVVRSSTSIFLYVDGFKVHTWTIGASDSLTGTIFDLGDYYSTSYPWKGYMDQFRGTQAARYTASSYELASEAFPAQ